jgi:hypothetical protein
MDRELAKKEEMFAQRRAQLEAEAQAILAARAAAEPVTG